MEVKLTQYSHGAGCGCKISPKVLDEILQQIGAKDNSFTANLLVGNESKDDAAAYDLGDGTAIISTTDFFMPIVDDAFDFGMIASVNAISDVYAMGGTPLMAIAILGWPINKLPPHIAARVLDGARAACGSAQIALAGGHSIDAPEPIFGLAVTGRVAIKHLKQNNTAREGDILYLTKPLGIGALTTAVKQNKLQDAHSNIAPDWMKQLNSIGAEFGKLDYVHALTDVTGFGLLGHLTEMCEGSKLSAVIYYDKVPVIPEAIEYITQGAVPGGTHRNWDSYGDKIALQEDAQKLILADPQTSGGLLVAVAPQHAADFEKLLEQHNIKANFFGSLIAQKEKLIYVQ